MVGIPMDFYDLYSVTDGTAYACRVHFAPTPDPRHVTHEQALLKAQDRRRITQMYNRLCLRAVRIKLAARVGLAWLLIGVALGLTAYGVLSL